jgi:hypothetical protein
MGLPREIARLPKENLLERTSKGKLARFHSGRNEPSGIQTNRLENLASGPGAGTLRAVRPPLGRRAVRYDRTQTVRLSNAEYGR